MSVIAKSTSCLRNSIQFVSRSLASVPSRPIRPIACHGNLQNQQLRALSSQRPISTMLKPTNPSSNCNNSNLVRDLCQRVGNMQIFNPSVTQVRTYKQKVALRLRCKSCYFERRDGRLFVECTRFGRHKQMQFMPKWKKDIMSEKTRGNWKQAVFTGYKKDRYYRFNQSKYADATQVNWVEGKIGVTL